MDDIVTSVVAGLIIAASCTVSGILWQQLKQAREKPRLQEARQERQLDLLSEAVRELLLSKLETIRRHMVFDDDGVADDATKKESQRIYDIYHAMGGNGHGTALNNDIQTAPIAPKPKE